MGFLVDLEVAGRIHVTSLDFDGRAVLEFRIVPVAAGRFEVPFLDDVVFCCRPVLVGFLRRHGYAPRALIYIDSSRLSAARSWARSVRSETGATGV